MSVLDALQNRHSVRTYTGEPVSEEALTAIVQAGLLSASGRNRRPWELIVVRDKEMLKTMSAARDSGAGMLANAEAAIVVVANPDLTDVWVEDCSIVMANMHLTADSLGIGSCWIQGRLRKTADGESTEDYLRRHLGYPDSYKLEAMLSLGMPKNHPPKTEIESLHTEKVHYEKF